jgi:uncharacterized protein
MPVPRFWSRGGEVMSVGKHWYVADPVHKILDFDGHDAVVKRLVAAPALQRLRRISQLGLASFVFPGAVHTRFSHSLGAAHLAAQACRVLSIEPEQSTQVVCAALLHDVGHGPFSHSFERALRRTLGKDSTPRHEDWTRAVVHEVLSPVLTALGVESNAVNNLIHPSETEKVPAVLKQLISSQLDVDRIDYLCRDSHFSGVAVGAIDVQYLIRSMRIVEHAQHRTLGLSPKGIPCYEAFAFARHVMNRTVYFHKKVATFEAMMEECIRLLVESDDVTLPFLAAVRHGKLNGASRQTLISTSLPQYIQLTEDHLWVALQRAAQNADSLGVLAARLLAREPVPCRWIAPGKHEIVGSILQEAGYSDRQFRIRTLPSSLYMQESGEQIFVRDEASGHAVHISERSSLVGSLRDQVETRAVLVVFDDKVADDIISLIRQADCLDGGARPSSPPSQRSSRAKPLKPEDLGALQKTTITGVG